MKDVKLQFSFIILTFFSAVLTPNSSSNIHTLWKPVLKRKEQGTMFPCLEQSYWGLALEPGKQGCEYLFPPFFGACTFACWARGLFPCSLRWGTSPIIFRYGHIGNDSETLWGVILGMACQIWIWVVLHCWISVIIIVCPKQTHALGIKASSVAGQ